MKLVQNAIHRFLNLLLIVIIQYLVGDGKRHMLLMLCAGRPIYVKQSHSVMIERLQLIDYTPYGTLPQ